AGALGADAVVAAATSGDRFSAGTAHARRGTLGEPVAMSRSSRAARVVFVAVVAMMAVAAPAVGAPGQLDPTFGTAGRALVPLPVQARPSDLVVEDDGGVVVTGSVGGGPGLVVVRFLPDGSLDP